MIEFEVRLYGPLRRYEIPGQPLRVSVGSEATVADVKLALAEQLGRRAAGSVELVAASALADEERILGAREPVGLPRVLSILPPVCGG